MTTFKLFLLLTSFLALALISSSVPLRGLSKGDYIPCALRLDVKTLPNGGTTSNVSFTLTDQWLNRVAIPNLVEWNRLPQPPGHVFFQSGQLDHLAGPVDCNAFTGQICYIDITITGTGDSPRWGCESIVVDSPVPVVGKKAFPVNEWLTEANNYNHLVGSICPRFSKGMTGGTKGFLAV